VELCVVAGRSQTQAGPPHAFCGWPMLIYTCHAHAALCCGLDNSFSEQHGRGMACVNQTQPHCVNQMGKTQSKHAMAGEQHGRSMGMACYMWISLKCTLFCGSYSCTRLLCTKAKPLELLLHSAVSTSFSFNSLASLDWFEHYVKKKDAAVCTVHSESCCALRIQYVDVVVSIEVAVEVCCCFTVFS
jgi:hypothetical protein